MFGVTATCKRRRDARTLGTLPVNLWCTSSDLSGQTAPPSPPGQPCDEQDLLKCAPNKAPCTNSNNVDSHHNNTGRQVNNVFCGIDENFGNLQKQILFGRHEPCTSLFLSASMSEQILCPVRDSPRDGANALARLLPSQIRLKMASPLTHRNIWDMLGPLKIKSVPPLLNNHFEPTQKGMKI